ncbi:MAG: outer membrane beta-barrel protein [Gammaproteobacteria bacterium]
MIIKNLTQKQVLSIAFACVTSFSMLNANAALKGPYVGGQLGFGNVHQDTFTAPSTSIFLTSGASGKDTGIAGRVYFGYLINCYAGAELGYSKFSNTNTKLYATQIDDITGGTITHYASGTIATDAFDLVGKGIIPFQNGFNLYGKLGVAYLRGAANINYSMTEPGVYNSHTHDSEDAHKFFPTFGLGVGYDVTQHVSSDVSWNRIQKVGNSSQLNSTDLFAVGLAYNFG